MEHHHLRHQASVPRRVADPVNQRSIGAGHRDLIRTDSSA
jgi:hypothetical protein